MPGQITHFRSILSLGLCLASFAQSANSQQLATGSLLVATPKSRDPDFARTVVLLIHYDSEAAIGLMLNRPTSVPVSEVLPEAKGGSVTVYAGGHHRRSRHRPIAVAAFFRGDLDPAKAPGSDFQRQAARFVPPLRRIHGLDRAAVAKRSRAGPMDGAARECQCCI